MAACDQVSNQEPVVRYDDGTVQRHWLRSRTSGSSASSTRREAGRRPITAMLDEYLGIDQEALGLIAVLLLRGPQTAPPSSFQDRANGGAEAACAEPDTGLERMADRPRAHHASTAPSSG